MTDTSPAEVPASERRTSTRPPPCATSRLPEELIDLILQCVHALSSNDFWSCLKTCKLWHRVGLGVLAPLGCTFHVIVESNSRRLDMQHEKPDTKVDLVTNFAPGVPPEMFLSMIRSLTVHVTHARIAVPPRPLVQSDVFGSLIDVFKIIPHLSSFSVKFSDEGWDFPHMDVPAIPSSELARVVAALPCSVVNLELDSLGMDLPPSQALLDENPKTHLCYQISRIFSRLQHLRLRVAHVCESLFLPATIPRSDSVHNHCQHCKKGCDLLTPTDTHNLQQLTIWEPWGSNDHARSCIRSIKYINNCQNPHLNIILIHQRDRNRPGRTSIAAPDSSPYASCTISLHSNNRNPPTTTTPSTTYPRPLVYGFIDASERSAYSLGHQPNPNTAYDTIARIPIRYYEPGGDAYPRTAHAYLATWWLERSSRWAQDGYLGPRYPINLADDPSKLFWRKASRAVPDSAMTATTLGSPGSSGALRLFQCLFPGCRERCESIEHLRGHVCYAHPERPHHRTWYGRMGCPWVGCDRVGERGFEGREELESHVALHEWKNE